MFESMRQGGVFLTMVYAGLLCGVLYDVLRAARRIGRMGRLTSAAADGVFWMGCAWICASALLRVNGEVRLYALLGACCGMCLYLMGVSEMLYAGVRGVRRRVCSWAAKWTQSRKMQKREKIIEK